LLGVQRAWGEFEQRLSESRKHPSEEAVHELRVSSRRLIACLDLCLDETRDDGIVKARRSLKKHLKLFGPLRDAHVQRLLLERHLDRFPELLVLRDHVRAEERRRERELARQTQGIQVGRMRRALRGLVRRLEAQAGSARSEQRLTVLVVSKCAEAWHEVLKRHSEANVRDVSTIHRERIAFKRFRYMIQAVSPALTGLNNGELLALARYQRKLGTIQDLNVLERRLAAYLGSHHGSAMLLKRFGARLRRRRAAASRAYLAARFTFNQFWPAVM
jgi:CHAD domain-containing protein